MIYLDNNATTAIDPSVLEAIHRVYQSGPNNPSSQHQLGQQARNRVEQALEMIGQSIGSRLDQPGGARLLLTSGGTESNNLALHGIGQPGPMVISRIEHPSVIATAEALAAAGRPVRWIDTDDQGRIRLDHLADLIAKPSEKASLVSIMSANNETGVLQPINTAIKICRDAGVPIHIDAAQSIGKLSVDLDSLGASAVTFAAHKFHGPAGIGALWIAPGVKVRPLMHGGQQQLESRPGTEPVALIVGMAKALQVAWNAGDQVVANIRQLRDQLESELLARHPEIVVQGHAADRLPGTSCISFVGTDRQSMIFRSHWGRSTAADCQIQTVAPAMRR